MLDLALCLLALPVLLPAMGLLALATWLDSPGPVLYRARRVGLDGRTFTMFKLRSMRHGVDGPGITGESDDRITPLGRWLRRRRLDELPQVFNVLRGDMRLVGPRPELPECVAWFPDEYRRILTVRPGITGATQLVFTDEERLLAGAPDPVAHYREAILPSKIASDLRYVERPSLLGDLALLLRTLSPVAGGRGWPSPTGSWRDAGLSPRATSLIAALVAVIAVVSATDGWSP